MFKLAWIFVVAITLAGCAPAKPDPLRQGERLMAELRTASGGPALDAPSGFHETGTIAMGGQTGAYETWGDFHALRWVGTRTRGGVTATRGFDGQTAWSMGPDGVVRTDSSPEGLASARLSTYLTIGAYLYPDRFPARFEYRGRRAADGVSYDVVTVTPAGATPIDFWLDVRTHQLQRLSGVDSDGPFLGVVERYQVVDGVSIPFAIRQTAGGQVMAQTLTLYEFVDPPAERFAPPRGKPARP